MIDRISRSTFVESEHNICILDVAPAVHQDLREWCGANTGRGSDFEMCSVELNGFFNRVNRMDGLITISEKAYAHAGPELKCLIDMVLDRKLPLPFPLANHCHHHHHHQLFLGELIVEGYRRTRPLHFIWSQWPSDG